MYCTIAHPEHIQSPPLLVALQPPPHPTFGFAELHYRHRHLRRKFTVELPCLQASYHLAQQAHSLRSHGCRACWGRRTDS